ncbi:sugar phosphate nucleotidyltransferase [Paenibacillus foliorum]|uniref:sugar phosphate nucleotidyltransferase n=1 Tax=Paenibacillus foliorum TaxID=2654974 RepID=UPI001490BC85|nr:sugar phosphate nucleotidyltransferase [Paenibacillus foliorum]
MRIVLLSGGSGKRLWPLSNEIRSKVFLKLLNSEDGGKESMIQRVCRQLDAVGLLPNTSIVTHKSQFEITQNHIGETVPIICEPYKRGTFTAIALSAAYFHSKLNADPNETICVLPVDVFVETAFFQLLYKLHDALASSQADLALIGTVPRHPSNQYGYIVPYVNSGSDFYSVAQFAEKPDETIATRLINQHALWNCGVFAFSLNFMLSYLKNKGLPIDYDPLHERYKELPEVSFDHEVVEKTAHSVVIPYDGAWKDLGSWDTLTNHLESSVIGIGELCHNSVNTQLVNELPIPIHIIDVPNAIVAASPDGILVASKSKSSQIKQRLSHEWARTMYEEKSWGTSRVLDLSKGDEETETVTSKMVINHGKKIDEPSNMKIKKIWTVISGSGEFTLNDVIGTIKAGDVLEIPCGVKHSLRANRQLEIIEVYIKQGN